MNKQELPEWFTGTIYDKGETVTNPFSGEEYELNAKELSIYDFIMGSQYIMELAPKTITQKNIDEFHEALEWFREANSEAYKILLD